MAALVTCGCGVETVAPAAVGVIRQAGKTGQGKTGQGKTGQGPTLGTGVTAALKGGWTVRTSVTRSGSGVYASGTASLALVGTKPGSELTVGAFKVPSDSFPSDQLAAPLATLNLHDLDAQGAPVMGTSRAARIVNARQDSGAENLMGQVYRDVVLNPANGNRLVAYKLQVLVSGAWQNVCQGEASGGYAVFFPGIFDKLGAFRPATYHFAFACLDGTAAKCARWGYRPWLSLSPVGKRGFSLAPVSLEPLWKACYRAASADYCNDGRGYTQEGTPIDLWDRYGFMTKTPESVSGWGEPDAQWLPDAPLPDAYTDESAFDENGAVCLVRERWAAVDQTLATCRGSTTFLDGSEFCTTSSVGGTWSACGPKGTVYTPTNIFDRGTISCTNPTRPPLVYVASAPSCTSRHDPFTPGVALPADCNFTTATVCADRASCCAEDSNGLPRSDGQWWDSTCVTMAGMVAAGTYTPGSVH